jgi:hypothetical protein
MSGDSEGGRRAVSFTTFVVGCVLGEKAPLSCVLHSDEQYSLYLISTVS